MVHKNLLRLLAAVLVLFLCIPAVSAEAGSRLAVEREVFEYLTTELNLSDAAACGVLANIEHESAFQPTIFGDKGTSYGLCQWHNERFTALRGYCAYLGLDYRTVEGQMAYLKYELGTNYVSLLMFLQGVDDTPEGAYKAAYQWCVQFERPSNMQVKAAQRGELARGKYWPRYNNFQPIIIVLPEPEPTEPDPDFLIEQLKQNPVTIPLPPEETARERGEVRYITFEKPEFQYYTPHHLPGSMEAAPARRNWELPTLLAIGAAMILVVIFPTKKRRRKVYSEGRFVVR